MFLEDFKNNDYIVSNDPGSIPRGRIVNIDTFIDEANSDEGIDIGDGDLYCHIPDFDLEIYQTVKEVVPDSKWFVFTKAEIPSWFKYDEAVVITDTNNQAVGMSNSNNNSYNDNNNYSSSNNDNNYSNDGSNNYSDSQESDNSTYNSSNDNDNSHNDGTSNEGVDETYDANSIMNSQNGNGEEMTEIKSLFESSQTDSIESGNKEAKIYVFGSSKGGTGKTFTCLISAYRYAKTHPGEKIAVADFDIIDGQVGISIKMIQPTMMSFWRSYLAKDTSFETMKRYSTKSNNFPNNIDFYLAPKDYYINDKKFWITIIQNLIKNYDTVFFDTGIDYINYPPISFAYKLADRIVLTSTTSIKSVSSVLKQINKLKGVTSSANAAGVEVFSKDDEIGPRLRLAITGYNPVDTTNKTVIGTFSQNIKINAIFGQYSADISRAEYYGEWDLFDTSKKFKKFNQSIDKLLNLSE